MPVPYHGKLLLGLTGNIACGKSTVLRRLSELGTYTIDADAAIHTILKHDGPAYKPVVAEFGKSILQPDGEIDRRALGKIVFSDPRKLRRLEEIEHPIVRRYIDDLIKDAPAPVVALDAIKLIEAGWADKCDTVWVVTCTRAQQLDRLMQTRDYSREEADMRIDAQSPQQAKIDRADTVIDNSGTLAHTRHQVDTAWRAFLYAHPHNPLYTE
jgi:dephospho-CoA kinase